MDLVLPNPNRLQRSFLKGFLNKVPEIRLLKNENILNLCFSNYLIGKIKKNEDKTGLGFPPDQVKIIECQMVEYRNSTPSFSF